MQFSHAILRQPGHDFAAGLTSVQAGAIGADHGRALEQHVTYREALEGLGLDCTVLDPLPGLPDAWFVEDAAVVTPGPLAIITRPGAPSRRGELASLARAIAGLKPLARIEAPGTLDGGDVLFAEGRYYIGLSERTNENGAGQLAALLNPIGIESTCVRVPVGLHLKSSVNYLGGGRMLLTPAFAREPAFASFEHVLVEPDEAYATNTLAINGTALMPAGYPRLRSRLERLGYPVIALEMGEAARMDGGPSCLSLRF